MIVGILAAFLGTMAFAVIFQVPRRYYAPCGAVGALAWLVYVLLPLAGAGELLSCATASFLLTGFSRTLAVIWRTPVSVFLIPGIFPLVPGTGMFYIGYYLVLNQRAQLAGMASQVLLMAGAIAVGITIGSAMPQKWFHGIARQLGRLTARRGKR